MKTNVALPPEEGDTGESAIVPGAGRSSTPRSIGPRPAPTVTKGSGGGVRLDLSPARIVEGEVTGDGILEDPAAESVAVPDGSPFEAAAKTKRRLKLFLWGDTGTGKTSLALQFPAPVVVDLEAGTEHYGHRIEFARMKEEWKASADGVHAGVDWLATNAHGFRTLIIDPFTVYWEMLQVKWAEIFLRRNRGKGFKHEFYQMQPADWVQLKADLKAFVRRLLALDMNVICIAREKTKYAPGEMMKAIGETFDGEKSLPYLFDVIVRTHRDEHGAYRGELIKDRTSLLPVEGFDLDYSVFEDRFGTDTLGRVSEVVPPVVSAVHLPALTSPPAALVPITPAQTDLILDYLAALGLDEESVDESLRAHGSEAGTVAGLDTVQAEYIIAQLADAWQARAAEAAATPLTPPVDELNDDIPF